MPHPATFPDAYDMVPTIRVSRLKEWGYLDGKKEVQFTISWTQQWGLGNKKIVDIHLNTIAEHPYMNIKYKYGNVPVDLCVWFDYIPSNLGKGKILYFECPITSKRCRKLYLIGKHFGHRDAFPDACYMSQTLSASKSWLNTGWVRLKRKEKALNWLHGKHFKTHYKGKPTKRYLQALKWIREAEGISEEMLLLG